MTHFEQTIADGQRVIEDGIVRKVAHGEAIDPLDWTHVGFTCGIDSFDSEPANKHDQAKSVNRGESIRAVCTGPVSLPVAASRRKTVTEAES